MNHHSHADLGGRPCSEHVLPEAEGDLFHADWEPRALAVTLAMGATGSWNIDMSRAARETLPDYARSSYYRIWIGALEKLLAERQLVLPGELAAGRAPGPARPVPRVLKAADVPKALANGSPTERPSTAPARFRPGDRVRTRNQRVDHHTRLPGYAHGKRGVIESVRAVHVFADTHAQGLGEQPQWLYSVVFSGAELWGTDAADGSSVALDAWESYLQPDAS
jgi:nitrile hydratase subunit beta